MEILHLKILRLVGKVLFAGAFLFPLGGARGGGRAIADGGVGGVMGIGERLQKMKNYYNDTLVLTKLPVGQFGIFFLRRLTRRILQAKPKKYAVSASLRSAPSVCKWVALGRVQEGEPTKKPRRLACFPLGS